MNDRRQAERVAVRLAATYRSEHHTTHGVVTDLSRRGLYFEGAHGEAIGTHATVEVHLADRRLIVQGRVARIGPHPDGVGLHFDDLADHARRQIANIVLSAHSSR